VNGRACRAITGFLSIESAREYVGIPVSYSADLDSIKNWKENSEYLDAKKLVVSFGRIRLTFVFQKKNEIKAYNKQFLSFPSSSLDMCNEKWNSTFLVYIKTYLFLI
jgi:hypothetical protein